MTVEEFLIGVGFAPDEASKKRVENSANALRSTLNKALGFIGVTLSIAGITAFGKQAVQAASDLEQMEQKFGQVFDGIEQEATSWAEKTANETGRATSTIKKYMADSQNLLVGFMGQENRAAAMDMSEKMTSLAMDLASFANTDEATAVERMTKAVMGQSEAARGLGAVLNDVTRQQAMLDLGIQGSYDSLDQATRMQVNYQAILNQSLDAVGDCARSINSFESQNRQLNNRLLELKQTVGSYILPFASRILQSINGILKPFNEWLKGLGNFNDEGSRINQLLDRFSKAIERVRKFISGIVNAIRTFVNGIGGAGNALKLLGMILAAVAIQKHASTFISALKGIGSAFTTLGLKGMILIGIILLIFLAVDDFIAFMQGRPSVLGDFLNAHDIDAEGVRAKILEVRDAIVEKCEEIKAKFDEAKEKVKLFFSSSEEGAAFRAQIAQTMEEAGLSLQPFRDALQTVKDAVQGFWKKIQEALPSIQASWSELWGALTELGDALEPYIQQIGAVIWAFIGDFATGVSTLFESLMTFWGSLVEAISPLIDAIKSVVQGLTAFLTGDTDAAKEHMEEAWNSLKEAAGIIWEGIKAAVSEPIENIVGLLSGWWEDISSAASDKWNDIKGSISDAVDGIVKYVTDGISALPGKMLEWAKDMLQNFWNGLTDNALVNGIKGAIGKVAELIAGPTEHTVPDEGPLKDDDKWTIHFMENLINGINVKKSDLKDTIDQVAEILKIPTLDDTEVKKQISNLMNPENVFGLKSLFNSEINPEVIGATVNSDITTVNQYNYFNTSFSGTDQQNQVKAAKVMNQNARDTTSFLSHAMNYAR